jgi:hypothetical protein
MPYHMNQSIYFILGANAMSDAQVGRQKMRHSNVIFFAGDDDYGSGMISPSLDYPLKNTYLFQTRALASEVCFNHSVDSDVPSLFYNPNSNITDDCACNGSHQDILSRGEGSGAPCIGNWRGAGVPVLYQTAARGLENTMDPSSAPTPPPPPPPPPASYLKVFTSLRKKSNNHH